MASSWAAWLSAQGLSQGDRCAILAHNDAHWCAAYLGILKLGAIVVPLNPTYSERELQHALDATGAGTVVVLSLYYQRVKSVQANTSVRQVVSTSSKAYLPAGMP